MEGLEDRCLLSAGGDLDLGFSGDGRRTMHFGNSSGKLEIASSVAIQSDGGIVLAGVAETGSQLPLGNQDFGIIRLTNDGSRDDTFGSGGEITVAFDQGGDNADVANAVAVQSNGKIVVAGTSRVGSWSDFAVVRLNANGSLDTTFSGDGKVSFGMSSGGTGDDGLFAVAIQPDGKIVLAGFASFDTVGTGFALARLNTNGSLDTTFGNSGKAYVHFDQGDTKDDQATSLVLQPDGKIVVAGHARVSAAGDYDFAVARLNANGTLDTTFDGDGRRVIAFDRGDTLEDQAFGVALQTDGKIVVAGHARISAAGDYDFAVCRLTTTGALDTSFDGDGRLILPLNHGSSNADRARGVVVQPDGKIVVVGSAAQFTSGDLSFAAVRLHPNGALDATFSEDGKRTLAFSLNGANGRNENLATAVALQPDGNIVLAGTALLGTSLDYEFAAARLIGDLWVVVAPDQGGPPTVRVYSPTGILYKSFNAYGASFTGGVRIATGEVTGDSTPDIFVAPGPGGQPFVNVFDGNTLGLLRQYQVYGLSFTGGINLAVANVIGAAESAPELIVAPDRGGQPYVNIFDIVSARLVKQLLVYGVAYTGGVRIAAADVNGDGVRDILTAPQAGGAPVVNMFNANAAAGQNPFLRSLQVYGSSFTGGIYMAVAELDGDDLLVVGPGSGGEPYVNTFVLRTGQFFRQYQAYGLSFTAGVRVGALVHDDDTFPYLVTAPGPGGQPYLQVIDGDTRARLASFAAYSLSITSGLFVVGSQR